ncbi:glycosyltransferase family 4 protein [Thiorhodovibrio frisius]|uniref:Glycosyltransferase n=1 Tax=Thiorhodovibrio frisius TaxID=631362 RepID=H8Z0J3_9GAMM|nr:glycosyltransferase family 4 protein [Thiorhodovibrio frisius]EIC21294.1 glycosyltransferase [Thiorhodovibrio frisius]WPL23875.1 GDP-mannose-dependent alpha-(1-6)-phosphatidylinositol monomannoside mannosyltransferase [Thiorhodovibrio frisius]
MRILILSKRQYTSRDLLDDRYGRLRELPLALADLCHDLRGVCLSYRPRDEGRYEDIQNDARVIWQACNAHRLLPFGRNSYWNQIQVLADSWRPDVVLACSDALHAVLGERLARKLGAALVIDLYDNFESFQSSRLPGLRSAFRRAVRGADGVVCISKPLAGLVRDRYGYHGPLAVIENAVPAGLFHPHDRLVCRRALALPEAARLIGTAGALTRNRGIEVLFRAFEHLGRRRADVHLVLAGPRDKSLRLPCGDHVHDLGCLAPDQVPNLLSALDVGVICNRDSAFGRYCFPQKFYEMVACGIPVVAAATGSMADLLRDWPGHLYAPDDPESLAGALNAQLDDPQRLPFHAPCWHDLAKRLECLIQDSCS